MKKTGENAKVSLPAPFEVHLRANPREKDLLDFSAHLFRDPSRLVQAVCHRIQTRVSVKAHKHTDLIQLDFFIGCKGEMLVSGTPIMIKDVTAVVSYPYQTHGFWVEGQNAEAQFHSLKLRVSRSWPVIKNRIFPQVSYCVSVNPFLIKALQRLNRAVNTRYGNTPVLLSILAEILCFWPQGTEKLGLKYQNLNRVENLGKGMEASILAIEERLNSPPSLKELAEIAFLSSRHYARRFQSLYGCSPHAYMTSMRLARARELLLDIKMNISEIAESMGFPSIHSFSRWFQRESGMSPTGFRDNNPLF